MQVKERTFSVSNMIIFTFNSQQYFKYFDFHVQLNVPVITLMKRAKKNILLLHTSSKYRSHHPTLVINLTEKSAPDSPLYIW